VKPLLRGLWIALLLILPALAWGQSCTFNGGVTSIGFGSLDPSIANTRTAFTDVKVKCNPASGLTPTWQFTGQNGNAPLKMKHASQNAFIPYSVSPSFQGSTGVNQNWRVTATVLGTDYQNALVGNYSDTLTATITP
jgi:spore coat protein U-like protein